MTDHRHRRIAVIALGVMIVLAGLSLAELQTTTGLLIDDNETANASFSSGEVIVIGDEQSYDGSTVCVGNTDCGDVESEDESMAPPGEAVDQPALDHAPHHFDPGSVGR